MFNEIDLRIFNMEKNGPALWIYFIREFGMNPSDLDGTISKKANTCRTDDEVLDLRWRVEDITRSTNRSHHTNRRHCTDTYMVCAIFLYVSDSIYCEIENSLYTITLFQVKTCRLLITFQTPRMIYQDYFPQMDFKSKYLHQVKYTQASSI